MAKGSIPNIDSVVFALSMIAGGSPVNLNTTSKQVVIGYKDQKQFVNNITWIISKQNPADDLLEAGELAGITVDLTGLTKRLVANTTFNLEIKPPKGAVLNINRTIPTGIQPVMDLN